MEDFKCLIQGIDGAEGPCVSRDGRLFMVGPSEGRIIEVLPDGDSFDLANTGGIPAGLQIDRNNDLWLADMKLGIFRIGMDGMIYPEVTSFEDEPIRGCNDCYFDSAGNLYWTAPAGSSGDKPIGEVYCRLTDGTVRRLDSGYAFSNGLAVTADDKTLIVAETFTKRLYAFDIVEPGVVTNKRIWAVLPGDKQGGPDGIDFDASGRLLATHFGSSAIEIFEPDGTHARSIELPFEQVTNVHWTGPDSTTIIITEMSNGGLWQYEYGERGQLQFGLG